MEIEVKVTATTEVAVDVTVTPVDGRFPGPPGAPRSCPAGWWGFEVILDVSRRLRLRRRF
jgi:hypothetical protein